MMPTDAVFFIFPLLGIVAGILAGMLGVGGGLILVPALIIVFHWQGLDVAHVTHLAIGTSLATIIITSISSSWAHHRKGAIEWPSVWSLAPGLMVGAVLGAWLAGQLDTLVLQRVFGGFELLVALWMLAAIKIQAHRDLPGRRGQSIVGLFIGGLSGLVGIGGGTLTVPWLAWHGRNMRQAVATSAACGLPIAMAGTLGFIIFGAEATVVGSSGYVYWPAVIGVGLFTLLAAPIGVYLAHSLPLVYLKRTFAVLLLVTGLRLLY